MRLATSFIAALASLCSLQVASAAHVHVGDLPARRHQGARSPAFPAVGRRDIDVVPRHDLQKRFSDARFTFYKTGLGACGAVNSDSDFIVALNHGQFDSGDYCFKTITIQYGGHTAQAQITDRCAECPYGALDFSPGLFDFFASSTAGEIYGSWVLGAAPSPSPTKTTSKYTPPPTSTWSPKPTPTVTTTSISSTITSSAQSSSTTSASATTSSTPPTALPTGNLSQLNLAVINLSGLITLAAKAHGH